MGDQNVGAMYSGYYIVNGQFNIYHFEWYIYQSTF